jgi:hypothetical protein
MKFAHMGDCHLGGWRQPEISQLNLDCFKTAINLCLREKVDFVLITGDFFDNPYPSIETLKEAFSELRKLREEKIPVYYITGSHDYSAAGKTFLDVLEKSGFCQSVMNYEEKNGSIILIPTIHENVALYGFPGKKSSLEVDDIEKIKLQDSPGLFKILMLHTPIRDAVGNLPIKAVNHNNLPRVDYLAMSHLHINYCKENRVYSGPLYPNNISELEELKAGSFYIFNNGKINKIELKPKEVRSYNFNINNAITATEEVIKKLSDEYLKDKVIILRFSGVIEKGKTSDIDFKKIENYIKEKGAYVSLKSTSKLVISEPNIKLENIDSKDVEESIISNYVESNPNKFNGLIKDLINSLQLKKKEEEKSAIFQERLISEVMDSIENDFKEN